MQIDWPKNNEIEATVRVYARYSDILGKVVIEATLSNLSHAEEFVLLYEKEIVIDLTEGKLAQDEVCTELGKALQEKLKKVRADHYAEEQEIESAIKSLLALEYSPEES